MTRRLLIALAVAAAVLAAAPVAVAAEDAPCPRGVECRTVTVPLDRTGRVDGEIALRVGLVRTRRATRAPVLALAGGPGQATVPFATDFADELGSRRARRDLVTLDTRGTGWSGLVRCRAYEQAIRVSESAPATSCARELGATREFYTSRDVAADIEAVRRRLGVPRIAVYGISYGTRVALEYARRYPDHTDRIILDSPLEDGGSDPFYTETLQAVPRVLRTVCGYGCGGTKHPIADVRTLAARLRATPLRRWVRDGRSRVMLEVTEDDLYSLLVSTDLFVPLMQAFPIVVEEALKGRYASLIGLLRAAEELDELGTLRDFSPGVYAATLCEESRPAWDPAADAATRRAQSDAALAALPPTALGPFSREVARNAGLWPLCGGWPAPTRAPDPSPPLPDVPVLLLSGDLDLRTPLDGARRLAAQLSDAVLVREPAWGHGVLSAGEDSCGGRAAGRFLRGLAVRACRDTVGRSQQVARVARRLVLPPR